MFHLRVVKKIERPNKAHFQGRKFTIGGVLGVSRVGVHRILERRSNGEPDGIGEGAIRVDSSGIHVVRACAPPLVPSPPLVDPTAPVLPDFVQNFFDEAAKSGGLMKAGGMFEPEEDDGEEDLSGMSTQELLEKLQELSDAPAPLATTSPNTSPKSH